MDKVTITISKANNQTLLHIIRLLVEGGDNTLEFLSLARQYTTLEIPKFEDIIELYKDVVSGTKI